MILVAILPIVWLFLSLCVFRHPGHIACVFGLIIAGALSILFWGNDLYLLGTSVLEGACFAVWPILLVVVASMLLFRYSESSGDMDVIRAVLSGTSRDKRVLALILAWGFGGFLEAVAGFGTPVLIPGAILVALGFSPMSAVLACLVANTAPTPFAQIGIPALTLSSVSGLDAAPLGAAVACQIVIPSILLPFFIVIIAGNGIKALKGMFLITLISGLSFALPVFAVAYFVGPELPTLIGSICTIVCTVIASKRLYKGGGENAEYLAGGVSAGGISAAGVSTAKVSAAGISAAGIHAAGTGYSMKQILRACFPFILLLVLVLSTNMIPALHDLLARAGVTTTIYGGEGAIPLTFNWVLTPGVLILITIIITCALRRGGFRLLLPEAGKVARASKNISITVISIIAMAKVMSYSGMTDEIAVWLVAALGALYPLAAPAIGMIGTFITGSDTTCCVLFGGLQANAAASIGANQLWVTASNLSGAAIGKMISPQSIAIGLGIGGLDGKEGILLKKAVGYGLILLAVVCAVTFAYADS